MLHIRVLFEAMAYLAKQQQQRILHTRHQQRITALN